MQAGGNTAIITGASGKLGSQLAISLGRMGFCCLCHYCSNADAATGTAEQIRADGGIAKTVQANLANKEAIACLFSSLADMPPATVLVNSASIFRKTPASSPDFTEIADIMYLNTSLPLMLSMEFAARFSGKIAKIINITDIAGRLAWAKYSAYCASKAALITITQTLAKELAPHILVNAISPGIVELPDSMSTKEAIRQTAKVPLARAAKYQEIASALEFIIENDYLTGQIITVDGGRSL